jgi:hypothetical protein
MEEILFSHQPYFPVAEKTRQANRSKFFLDMLGIVIGLAEEPVPAPVATAQAPAVNRLVLQLLVRALQQIADVFGARRGIAPLKLDRLPGAREGPHR